MSSGSDRGVGIAIGVTGTWQRITRMSRSFDNVTYVARDTRLFGVRPSIGLAVDDQRRA